MTLHFFSIPVIVYTLNQARKHMLRTQQNTNIVRDHKFIYLGTGS